LEGKFGEVMSSDRVVDKILVYTEDRARWRQLVHGVTKPRSEDGWRRRRRRSVRIYCFSQSVGLYVMSTYCVAIDTKHPPSSDAILSENSRKCLRKFYIARNQSPLKCFV